MDLKDMSDNLLAHDKALYHGHAVAAVAATTLSAAREAADLVKVQYDVARTGAERRSGDGRRTRRSCTKTMVTQARPPVEHNGGRPTSPAAWN